ncbi:hypothetical protein NEOLEDRAFT_783843 [Neolentinus lepideus HHB14362 ss-1]|uniref:Uncharacterized protein n=1 Tax=Neolentinus lepideus HHB14362 ss-1 TaxID=1314782 RepID=A0A165UXK6_9AGAM|nr:hypothetical protein NEOLEDRAFT_783843 [Neolentinus lepideus HHB14362 ss-1]
MLRTVCARCRQADWTNPVARRTASGCAVTCLRSRGRARCPPKTQNCYSWNAEPQPCVCVSADPRILTATSSDVRTRVLHEGGLSQNMSCVKLCIPTFLLCAVGLGCLLRPAACGAFIFGIAVRCFADSRRFCSRIIQPPIVSCCIAGLDTEYSGRQTS